MPLKSTTVKMEPRASNRMGTPNASAHPNIPEGLAPMVRVQLFEF